MCSIVDEAQADIFVDSATLLSSESATKATSLSVTDNSALSPITPVAHNMVVETIAFLGLAYGARKLHKRHKSKRALRDAAAGVVDSQPPVYSSGPGTPSSWPKTALQVVNEVPENPSKHTHAALGTSSPAASATSSLPSYTEDGLEWRPVYLFERSTSKTQHNYIRIHRALFVGELDQSLQQGRTYEIKKQKASFLGLLSRDMTFTDAEQWLGAKQCDREPVYLGHTFWTDQQLNEEGMDMSLVLVSLLVS